MEELETSFELALLPTISEESEVTNALESRGQHVKQKAADKLVSIQSHRAALRVGFAATTEKGDFTIRNGLDSAIGDGDAMGVAAEVFQDRCG